MNKGVTISDGMERKSEKVEKRPQATVGTIPMNLSHRVTQASKRTPPIKTPSSDNELQISPYHAHTTPHPPHPNIKQPTTMAELGHLKHPLQTSQTPVKMIRYTWRERENHHACIFQSPMLNEKAITHEPSL
jgi:hypothetical protein